MHIAPTTRCFFWEKQMFSSGLLDCNLYTCTLPYAQVPAYHLHTPKRNLCWLLNLWISIISYFLIKPWHYICEKELPIVIYCIPFIVIQRCINLLHLIHTLLLNTSIYISEKHTHTSLLLYIMQSQVTRFMETHGFIALQWGNSRGRR